MTRKIVGIINLFDLESTLFVYEDGKNLEQVNFTIEALDEHIFYLTNKYNISQVDLVGARTFLTRVKNRIKEKEFAQYNKNILEINII